ncbi:MAG: hypothetical protein ACI841_003969 [Planctomycetota bacterium]|jgi:hypothetical protein
MIQTLSVCFLVGLPGTVLSPAVDPTSGWHCSIAPVGDVDKDGHPDFAVAHRYVDGDGIYGVEIRSS